MGIPGLIANAFVTEVTIGDGGFAAELTRPEGAQGLVLLVHGVGSDSRSPRSDLVVGLLYEHRFATLQFDLHDPNPADDVADAPVAELGERVVQALEWTQAHRDLAGLRCGLFGADRGAAAALVAAAARPMLVAALVTRGGRPDLAAHVLDRVAAPAMLIVGGHDAEALDLNRAALRRLTGPKRLEVVPRATHQFQEPGALVTAVELAAWWFGLHLATGDRPAGSSAH
ncbi:dienelactone hydrolase family protein [Ideonella sp. A 288]|uniref:dienelactone hydrolase family protein n=1 Tax=Ideonella sp. A 288 TaxID=1962181 RepID=UPI0018FE2C39|nr:alpha/beta hydrolase [Ideonella sp. A 288]